MDFYEKIAPLGEGTYGMVMKCRHKESGQMVAIKKFKDSEEDPQIKKTALREVKMLKQMKNNHIVNLLEVFRRKGRLYLVFEHIDRTILQEMEKYSHGIPDDISKGDFVRKSMWQILKALNFLHSQHVVHRDLKPEANGPGTHYTDYVSTRWYRCPELLVGDTEYGKPVDIWALGCIFSEMITGEPLFPGDTDLDQLHRIMTCIGPLLKKHVDIFLKNSFFVKCKLPEINNPQSLQSRVRNMSSDAFSFLHSCLIYDPENRATTERLMDSIFFAKDNFPERFDQELLLILEKESEENVLERLFNKKQQKKDQKLSTSFNMNASSAMPNEPVPIGWQSKPSKNESKNAFHPKIFPPQKISLQDTISLRSHTQISKNGAAIYQSPLNTPSPLNLHYNSNSNNSGTSISNNVAIEMVNTTNKKKAQNAFKKKGQNNYSQPIQLPVTNSKLNANQQQQLVLPKINAFENHHNPKMFPPKRQ